MFSYAKMVGSLGHVIVRWEVGWQVSKFIWNSCPAKTAINELTGSDPSQPHNYPHMFASRIKPLRFFLKLTTTESWFSVGSVHGLGSSRVCLRWRGSQDGVAHRPLRPWSDRWRHQCCRWVVMGWWQVMFCGWTFGWWFNMFCFLGVHEWGCL